MKNLTIALLSLPLVLISFHQVQSMSMDEKTDSMSMSQPMTSDDMKMEKTMGHKEKTMQPTEEELRQRLTRLQYKVTREEGTEPPFNNSYWDNHEAGLYVDLISGTPLFSSLDKYESGTGWPSFTRPLNPDEIVEKVDRRLFSTRTEVRSKLGDAHLGHVFNDGPAPDGLRYCLNSASLRFVPVADLEKEGYAEYLKLFK